MIELMGEEGNPQVVRTLNPEPDNRYAQFWSKRAGGLTGETKEYSVIHGIRLVTTYGCAYNPVVRIYLEHNTSVNPNSR